MKFPVRVVGVLAVAGAVAGCSGHSGPADASQDNSPPASSAVHQALPYGGAPKVASPLPASALAAHPCDSAFTAENLSQLFEAPPKGVHADLPDRGAGCRWLDQRTGAMALVFYSTKADGLSSVYADDRPHSKVWNVLPPIEGFPAVAHDSPALQAAKSGCQVSVGTSDQSTVDVSIGLAPANVGKVDPCAKATEVATAVIVNVKG